MANFATKIVLVGAVYSVIAELLPNNVVVGGEDFVIINPESNENSVGLDSWNDDLLTALARMSDDENGVEGEYFTKLGGDTTNFTAQRIYKAVKPITESNCFVNNNGNNGKPYGTETREIYFRKSTVAEILKQLGAPQSTNLEEVQFTISGETDEVSVFARVVGVEIVGVVGNVMTMTSKGLVATENKAEVNYHLINNWEEATKDVKEFTPKFNLPIINGYEGTIEGDLVVYGCAKIPKVYFQKIEGANRRIKSLELTSEIVINADDFEAIANIVNV